MQKSNIVYLFRSKPENGSGVKIKFYLFGKAALNFFDFRVIKKTEEVVIKYYLFD